MTGKEALKAQYGVMYGIVERNLTDMTEAQSLRQPEPFGNCANWIVAHMLLVHNAIMGLVGEGPAWDNPALERAREAPVTGAAEAFDWSELRSRFQGSRDRLLAGLDRLTDEQLDEPLVDPFGNPNTRGGLLNLLALHQNYHAGQLGLSRRLVGLEGVIKGPKPQPTA